MRRRRVQRPGFFCLLCVWRVCELVGTGAKSQSSASLFFVRSFLSQPRERETPRALKINNSGSPLLTNVPAAHGVHTAEPDSQRRNARRHVGSKKLVDGKIGRVQNLAQLRIDIIFAFHQVDL